MRLAWHRTTGDVLRTFDWRVSMTVQLERRDAVTVLTLDNPSAKNVLDDETRADLLDALQRAIADESRAVVLAGAGGSFCAGGDLASMPRDEASIRRRMGELHAIIRLVHGGPKPVAAAVEGVAFGSGLSLAAACDWLVSAENARFGCAFGKVGLLADTGLLWTLPQRVGMARARTIALTSATIEAAEGKCIGLVDEVCAPGDVLEHAVRWAEMFADAAPGPLSATRALLSRGCESFGALLESELQMQVALLASSDFEEGRTAFFEPRAPRFARTGLSPSRGQAS